MGEWQPIETAPKDGVPILVAWYASGERLIVRYDQGCWQTVPGSWVKHPSFWQPLPEPPSFEMTDDKALEAVARAMAGHFGPEFDALPKDEIERRKWNRNASPGTHYEYSKADIVEAARAAIDAYLATTGLEAERDQLRERVKGLEARFWGRTRITRT